jgi:hypothetical protein
MPAARLLRTLPGDAALDDHDPAGTVEGRERARPAADRAGADDDEVRMVDRVHRRRG